MLKIGDLIIYYIFSIVTCVQMYDLWTLTLTCKYFSDNLHLAIRFVVFLIVTIVFLLTLENIRDVYPILCLVYGPPVFIRIFNGI